MTSLWIARGRHNRPSSLMELTPAAVRPQPTCLGLRQRRRPLHPPISCLVLGIGVSRQSPRPGPCLPRARQDALAVADVSRHIRQEGSLSNTSCLPGRLQDKVPQALRGLQHCWPALWAPLLPPTGRQRQHLARSGGSSPLFLPEPEGTRVISSAQHPSGLIRALRPLWGPGDRLRKQRGSGEARRVCGAGAGSAWSREGIGVPHSTPRCLWGRHQGDGDRLFPALPGGRVRDRGIC